MLPIQGSGDDTTRKNGDRESFCGASSPAKAGLQPIARKSKPTRSRSPILHVSSSRRDMQLKYKLERARVASFLVLGLELEKEVRGREGVRETKTSPSFALSYKLSPEPPRTRL